MLKNIYLLLAGEDYSNRTRSDKLIETLKNTQNLNWSEIKIVISGKALFDRTTDLCEAKDIENYLLKNNIPKSCIILEDKGMDFIGDLLFSFYIIEDLILKEQGNTVKPETFPNITISLIAEKFYMSRAKSIFEKIFRTLISLNPNIKFDYLVAKNNIEQPFFAEIKAKKLIKQVITNPIILAKEDRVIRELGLLILANLDIKTFGLRTPEDFRKYLCFLPEYQELLLEKETYDKMKSWYIIAVNAFKN